jgi:hypothetical protein
MTAVLIPVGGVGELREALLCLLSDPVEGLAHTLTLPERELHPEWFGEDRREFERVCGVLDTIGWDAAAPARDVQLDGEHAGLLRQAVEEYLPLVEGWLAEAKPQRLRSEHRRSVQAMWSLLEELPGEHEHGEQHEHVGDELREQAPGELDEHGPDDEPGV